MAGRETIGDCGMTIKELRKKLKGFDQDSIAWITIEDERGSLILRSSIFGIVPAANGCKLKGVQLD